MLQVVLVRRQQVELGDVGVDEVFEIQASIRRQADQGGRWRERRRQPRARAVLPRAVPGERRCTNVVEIGRVVELKSRFRHQHLAEGHRRPILGIDVGRQQQTRAVIEHDAQLAPRGGDIIATKGMVRMLEVVDVSVANATREGDSPHHPVALKRPADPRVGAKFAEVPTGEPGRRLQLIRGRPGDQVDRSADGVAPIQGALGTAQHLDAIEIEKLHELHRRPSEVDAVEIHRRTGIRSGIDDVRANPADRELTETGVLRQRD